MASNDLSPYDNRKVRAYVVGEDKPVIGTVQGFDGDYWLLAMKGDFEGSDIKEILHVY